MNIKLNALCLGSFLALTAFLAQPVMADEWNKKIEFQFSAPVQVPGKVLPAGKYVFQLVDSDSDRNTVQVFSEDSEGKESLAATIMAIPDYTTDTPDKPVIHFEERHSGTPEAIHSYFYPGENTGWEFVYPKGQTIEGSTNATPAPAPVATTPAPDPVAPVATAPAPSLPPAPAVAVQETEPASEVAVVEEEILVAQNDAPAPPSSQETDTQNTADRTLPETGGHSDLQLMTGLAMFGGGIAAVFASRRKSVA
jgi:hypothetical protein